MSLQISLTPDLEQLVTDAVASGGYQDAGEVVRDALRQFFSVDDWAALDQEILPRLKAVEDGTAETISFEEFKASGLAFIDNV